jgi:hypothetical protein
MYKSQILGTTSSFTIQNPKYYIENCKNKITDKNKNTNGWINILDYLKIPRGDLDKSRILLALLDKHKKIVLKIGDNNAIKKEFEYGKKIYKNTKGFVKFICYFECNDNYLNYPNKKQDFICNGNGNSMKIIIMPFFELGNIGTYNWNIDNVNILKSSIKHSILSYIQLFMNGYLHGDFHPGNVLLKKTSSTYIDYKIKNVGIIDNIPTFGIRTWIMDFENMTECDITDKLILNNFYFDIKKFFILIQQDLYIKNIDKHSIIHLDNYINKLCLSGNILIHSDIIFILQLIDNITLIK